MGHGIVHGIFGLGYDSICDPKNYSRTEAYVAIPTYEEKEEKPPTSCSHQLIYYSLTLSFFPVVGSTYFRDACFTPHHIFSRHAEKLYSALCGKIKTRRRKKR